MGTAYVFLADGFEEIEALTPVDVLRRAGVDVRTVGVAGKMVTGSHDIRVEADFDGDGFVLPRDAAMVILPGGGTGAKNLAASAMVYAALKEAKNQDLYIAAICAAPGVLYKAGLLQGRRATIFPGMEDEVPKADITGEAVVQDGKIITGRSMGVALAFSQALATALVGEEKAGEVVAKVYPEA